MAADRQIAILCVSLMYLTTIVPSQLELFLSMESDVDSSVSKLNSMRQATRDQNEDNFGQKWGYKLDHFFNTAYVGIVYSLNIAMVFYTPGVIDIVLNALAIEFIVQLDETVADHWDKDRRIIRAGACELVIKNHLHLDDLDKLKVEYWPSLLRGYR